MRERKRFGTSVATSVRRNLALLELARARSAESRVYWNAVEIGDWVQADIMWRTTGNRIFLQFSLNGQRKTLPVISVRATPEGIDIMLADTASAAPKPLAIRWRASDELISRDDFQELREMIFRWLRREYPGVRILKCVKRTDRWRTLSGRFLRVSFQNGGFKRLLIAADENVGDDIALIVAQALLWVEALQSGNRPNDGRVFRAIPEIHILAPARHAYVIRQRCLHLNPARVRIEAWVYENYEDSNIRRAPDLPEPKENQDYRWPVLGPFRWSAGLEKTLDLAPELIRRYPRFYGYDSLRLRGLEFAQVFGPNRDKIFFGVGAVRTELTADNFGELKALVEEILYYRRADGPDTQHPYYKLQAERWLEALILENIPYLFPEMTPGTVYSQIPVYLGSNAGRVDILGVNRDGDMVVMELKVTENPDLLMQALDYWGRVTRHNRNGDFARRGYFSGTKINRNAPLIYLVAPVFSFHDTTERLVNYLSPEPSVYKIAVNEDWRRNVKILSRKLLPAMYAGI